MPNTSSVQHIPLNIHERFKAKLKDIVNKNIIENVNKPV